MFTASNMLSRAMDLYSKKKSKRKKRKIFLGKKKNRYYFNSRLDYRNEYLKSDHWKLLRSEKLKLNPICEKCGSKNRVEPHHLQYKHLYDVEVIDLMTLCRSCHIKVHNNDMYIHETHIT